MIFRLKLLKCILKSMLVILLATIVALFLSIIASYGIWGAIISILLTSIILGVMQYKLEY